MAAAAKKSDLVIAMDMHVVLVPSGSGLAPMSLPHPFSGALIGNLSSDVEIDGLPAAVVGSTASNSPAHVPTPPGISFQTPPKNQAEIMSGSETVFINGKGAARAGDKIKTCADPSCNETARLIAVSSVEIG